MDSSLPRLRAIEAFPVEVDARRLVCLRDPLQYASDPLLIAPHAAFVIGLLDGRRSVIDLQEAFALRFGAAIESEQIRSLVAVLDHHHYLESPRFAARRAEIDAMFRAASLRAAAHAGSSYPADADACRAHLDGFFADVPFPAPRGGPLRGLIAPHIDLRVGGRTYGHGYRALAHRAEAERFVVLGTSHGAGSTLFAATRKDFATPLGRVAVDRDFLARLERRVPEDLYRDEALHRTEHAIEFQVLMLQHVLGGCLPFRIVPILVTSFHAMILAGRNPLAEPHVAGFVQALRDTLAEDDRPTALVAGVDFAHVGEKFGDREGLSPALLAATEAKDRRLIAALEASDPSALCDEIARDGDRTRICGFAPMVAFLAVLGGVRGRLLHYDRTRDEATRSSVSYASLAYGLEG